MSIGKRLIDLARSELNSLLDKAAQVDGGDELRDYGGDVSSLSDAELAAEIERRRQAREEVEQAIHGRRGPPPRSAPRRTAAGDEAIRKAYAALEIRPGSDFETVRSSYRRLMRKYHPDLHAETPEQQRAATDLTQRLTEAYKTLERHLRR
ncbi:MAG TPA: J domain-containing protein [Polyangia bacterium]